MSRKDNALLPPLKPRLSKDKTIVYCGNRECRAGKMEYLAKQHFQDNGSPDPCVVTADDYHRNNKTGIYEKYPRGRSRSEWAIASRLAAQDTEKECKHLLDISDDSPLLKAWETYYNFTKNDVKEVATSHRRASKNPVEIEKKGWFLGQLSSHSSVRIRCSHCGRINILEASERTNV